MPARKKSPEKSQKTTSPIEAKKYPQDYSSGKVVLVLNYLGNSGKSSAHALFGDFSKTYSKFKDSFLKTSTFTSYNPGLKFGPGWVIKIKTKLDEVKKALKKEGIKFREVEYADYLKEVSSPKKLEKAKSPKKVEKSPSPKKVDKAKKVELIFETQAECNQVRSIKHPNAPLKTDLVAMAVQKLGLTTSSANKMSKAELCKVLTKSKSPKKKSSPAKKTKKDESPKAKKDKNVTSPAKKTKKDDSPKAKKVASPAKKDKKNDSPKAKKSKKVTSPTKSVAKKSSEKKEKTKGKGCVERSNIKLHPHQKFLVKYLQTHRGIIAGFEVGTGKTLAAVTASQCFLDANPKGKVIVVTPKSLQENFKKELAAYGAELKSRRYEVTTMGKFCNKYENGIKSTAVRPIMLIVDEAHELRSSKSKRVKIMVLCASQVEKVLLLTGTLTYNDPVDVLPLVSMVKGNPVVTGKDKFYRMSTKEKCLFLKDAIMFYKNPKSADYPTVREHHIDVPMTDEYYKAYRRIETQQDPIFTEGNPFRFLTGVRMATNGIHPYPKKDWAIKKVLEGGKTIIYSSFLTHGIDLIKEDLKKNNIKYVEITGKKSAESRDRSVKKYNNDKVKVMIISKAGGLGLDTKGTRNVILLEKTWNKPNEDQVVGRAARYKSHTHLPEKDRFVDVYHLKLVKPAYKNRDSGDKMKMRGSADEMLFDLIQKKERDNAEFRKLLDTVDIAAPAGTTCPPQDYVDTNVIKPRKTKSSTAKKIKKAEVSSGPKEVIISDKRLSYNRPPVTDKFKKDVIKIIKTTFPKATDIDITAVTNGANIKYQVPANALKKNVAKSATDIGNYLRGLGTISLINRKWMSDNHYSVTLK
jgi:hypothetical protein